MGERMLEQWLRQPLVDHAQIARRHDIVGLLVSAASERDALRDGALKGMPDLDRIASGLRQRRAKLLDVYKLYVFTSQTVPALVEALGALVSTASDGEDSGAVEALTSQLADPLREAQGNFSGFNRMVDAVLDLESVPDIYIRPEYDEQLAGARDELEAARREVFRLHEELNEQFCGANDKQFDRNTEKERWPVKLDIGSARGSLSADGNSCYYLRLPKAPDENKLKKTFGADELQIISYLKNGVHFTTRTLAEAADAFADAQRLHDAQQQDLTTKVVATAATFMPVIEQAARIISELDVFLSFAQAVRFLFVKTPRVFGGLRTGRIGDVALSVAVSFLHVASAVDQRTVYCSSHHVGVSHECPPSSRFGGERTTLTPRFMLVARFGSARALPISLSRRAVLRPPPD
jgi:DNA mismatch repair ATPase MutS